MSLKANFVDLIQAELTLLRDTPDGDQRANRIAALARAAAIVQGLRADDVVDERTAEELEKALGNSK